MRVLEQAGVGGRQLVEKLAHLLRSLDIRVRLRGVLRLLHAGPRQEKSEVLVDLPQRERAVLPRLRVERDDIDVIGDDDETRAVLHHRGSHAQLLELGEQVPSGLAEIHHILLCHLPLWVRGDVERAVAQARDVALRSPVREQQLEYNLAVVLVAAGERLDTLLDVFQVESWHGLLPSSYRSQSAKFYTDHPA